MKKAIWILNVKNKTVQVRDERKIQIGSNALIKLRSQNCKYESHQHDNRDDGDNRVLTVLRETQQLYSEYI